MEKSGKFRLTSLERNWILYDVGNSAFVLMVATLIPIFFNALAEAGGLSSVEYLAYWGYAASAVTVITAILSPILGTLADTKGFKKPIFMLCLFVGVIGCCAMGLAGEIAHQRLTPQDGNATYRNYIIDAIYNMTPEQLEKGANYEVR